MPLIGYFGFGSLVNHRTLRTNYVRQIPARLKGWRRHWQERTGNLDPDIALLSIHRDESCAIDGVLVIDQIDNLAALDEREQGYQRHEISLADLELHPTTEVSGENEPPQSLYVYIATQPVAVGSRGALLQSYCDAVLQGYLHHFGEGGVRDFIATTREFDRPLIRDRHNPRYPRDVKLSAGEAAFFDEVLKNAGVMEV